MAENCTLVPVDKEANEAVKEQPNSMCMFINFPNGVPVPKLREEWNKIVAWEADQVQRLNIFHEMLKEKSIKAGTGSVGVKHRGWGNSRQK